MSNVIDILTVVDTVSLMNAVTSGRLAKGTQSNPTNLGSYSQSDAYIYMITASAYVVNDQAKSELTVQADVGDSVRWMITCPGGGTAYNVILMGWTAGQGATLIAPQPPLNLPLNLNLYVGSPTVAPRPIPFTNYCYQGTVIATGQIQYVITFEVLDENGNSLGFYCWDPFIEVSN